MRGGIVAERSEAARVRLGVWFAGWFLFDVIETAVSAGTMRLETTETQRAQRDERNTITNHQMVVLCNSSAFSVTSEVVVEALVVPVVLGELCLCGSIDCMVPAQRLSKKSHG